MIYAWSGGMVGKAFKMVPWRLIQMYGKAVAHELGPISFSYPGLPFLLLVSKCAISTGRKIVSHSLSSTLMVNIFFLE